MGSRIARARLLAQWQLLDTFGRELLSCGSGVLDVAGECRRLVAAMGAWEALRGMPGRMVAVTLTLICYGCCRTQELVSVSGAGCCLSPCPLCP